MQSTAHRGGVWEGTVPTALDGRVFGLIAVVAALAASVNVPYGGIAFAAVAFGLIAGVGALSHLGGERQLRGLVDELLTHWTAAGLEIERVERASGLTETGWTVRTPDGPIRITGIALVPIATLTITGPTGRETLAAGADEETIRAVAADCLNGFGDRHPVPPAQ